MSEPDAAAILMICVETRVLRDRLEALYHAARENEMAEGAKFIDVGACGLETALNHLVEEAERKLADLPKHDHIIEALRAINSPLVSTSTGRACNTGLDNSEVSS